MSEPMRRGRPPGSKNKVKTDKVARPAPVPRQSTVLRRAVDAERLKRLEEAITKGVRRMQSIDYFLRRSGYRVVAINQNTYEEYFQAQKDGKVCAESLVNTMLITTTPPQLGALERLAAKLGVALT